MYGTENLAGFVIYSFDECRGDFIVHPFKLHSPIHHIKHSQVFLNENLTKTGTIIEMSTNNKQED